MARTAQNNVIELHSTRTELQHDGLVNIAAGRSRTEMKWKNTEMRWSDLVAKLQRTTRTRETIEQYKHMSKQDQGDAKDVGGFVGGTLKGGRRKTGQVLQRSMLTLDADYAGPDFIDDLEMTFPYAFAAYTTHSHTPEAPRWRLLIPFKEPISPDECEALGRFTASDIGIDLFDDSTYETERLMYWPSTAEDGEFLFRHLDGPFMDPKEILERRPFWNDASTWPESGRMQHARRRHAERQGDPLEKPGAIGAFNRAYSIPEAIEKFIPDAYTECDVENRYTYTAGSTAAGMVVYDDGKFAFSNHGTDPAGGQLCNAFDLVRIHKFGHLDEDKAPDTHVNQLPSYTEMTRYAIKDDATRIELAAVARAELQEDFDEDTSWMAELSFTEKGLLAKTINNAILIMENDTNVKDAIGYDEFNRKPVTLKPLPWKPDPDGWADADDSGLRHYIENTYHLKTREDINDALSLVMTQHRYHPIREYLDSLAWDGTPRLDRLLIDLMGAEDTEYTKQVTRKWLAAAVARVREPGCKFDTMLILVGEQGVGKSQFFSRLARQGAWFSDSMSRFDNTKDCMEQLAGKWILEIGELASMKKSEVEGVKTFMSKQSDDYRTPYSKRPQNFPRQCVFGGTTNRDDFLQDATGGRRFWPVEIGGNTQRMWAELTRDYVDQVWAEADAAYALGEELYIGGEAAKQAREMQDKYTEMGGKPGMAELFLSKKVPENWDSIESNERTEWLRGYDFDIPEGTKTRETITGIELFVECFGGIKGLYRRADSYEMTDILRQIGWKKNGKSARVVDYGKQRTFIRAT